MIARGRETQEFVSSVSKDDKQNSILTKTKKKLRQKVTTKRGSINGDYGFGFVLWISRREKDKGCINAVLRYTMRIECK